MWYKARLPDKALRLRFGFSWEATLMTHTYRNLIQGAGTPVWSMGYVED